MRRYAGSIGRTAQGTNDYMDATYFPELRRRLEVSGR